MKENQVSFTAMMTAYVRAYYAMHNTEKIFDDFLAYRLIPEEKRVLIEQYLTETNPLNNTDHSKLIFNQTDTLAYLKYPTLIIIRGRYVEDTLEKAISQGVKQYVILGAGLDTFAFRRPELIEQLDVFEVDHPATQEFKIHRLAELGWKHPAKLHFIPTDFTKENLRTVLTSSSSYDPNIKSLFSWLGVTVYLTREEIFTTLHSITKVAPAGSIVVFDYFGSDMFLPENLSPQIQKKLEINRKNGEPLKTGINPATLKEDLANLGLLLHENLNSKDIKERYFHERSDGYFTKGYEYIACAIVE
jgi:methyltransferase (TIGR00027 family)